MSDTINQLPDQIKEHLKNLLESFELPNNEESFNLIAKMWLDKKALFDAQVKLLGMTEIESYEVENPKAALMLTFSGSLITLGPLSDHKRWVEYASIKNRVDVPHILFVKETGLARHANKDHGLEFISGPLKNTSAIHKIVVCANGVPPEEQEKRIREATIFLTNGFVKINRTLLNIKSGLDQFNKRAMVKYIAMKNHITLKQARQIIDDYIHLIETGILLGERVPVGKIGKLFLKKRSVQKARVVMNPKTGEEITIKAKPETFVPKITFYKSLKEKARSVLLN